MSTGVITFRHVWYRDPERHANRAFAFDDAGSLLLSGDQLQYTGRYTRVIIPTSRLKRISVGKAIGDDLHKWIRVEYQLDGQGKSMLLADGRLYGLWAFVGGTIRLFQQIRATLAVNGLDIDYHVDQPRDAKRERLYTLLGQWLFVTVIMAVLLGAIGFVILCLFVFASASRIFFGG